jgi:putative transposase
VKMCRWLGVGRPSFNEWRTRPLSAAAMRRDELRLIIAKSFDDSDGTYGYRRVHADLAAWGVACGLELVRKLMRDIASCRVSRGRPDPGPGRAGLHRRCSGPQGDITYISRPGKDGCIWPPSSIATPRLSSSGPMGDNYKTPLIEAAPDRDSNYTSAQFART